MLSPALHFLFVFVTFVVFLIKRVGAFLPQTQYVCVKTEAQYEG